jgi:hypothetical protein
MHFLAEDLHPLFEARILLRIDRRGNTGDTPASGFGAEEFH